MGSEVCLSICLGLGERQDSTLHGGPLGNQWEEGWSQGCAQPPEEEASFLSWLGQE